MSRIFLILVSIAVLQVNGQEYLSLLQPKSPHLSTNPNVDDDLCDKQITIFHNELRNREMWAVEMFDSWAKLQSGLFSMNTINLGDFDSCVRFRHDTKSSGIVQGQHCVTLVKASTNSSLDENEGESFSLKEV
jgi:hypothetical protein